MIKRLRNRERGFTLIELLIVVAIIGIIAAILIPNLIDAIQKAKQKRTVSDIRTAMTAGMAWVTDQASAGAAGRATQVFKWADNMDEWGYDDVVTTLAPSTTFYYIQKVPKVDGWGEEIEYTRISGYDPASPKTLFAGGTILAIRSLGRDGEETAPGPNYPVGTFIGTDYDQDIVFADGYPVYTPGGVGAVVAP